MSGIQSQVCVPSIPVLRPHSPFGETGGPRCLARSREHRSCTPLSVCGAFPESTPVFGLTSPTCEMREVLGCFAGQTSYGFLFGQLILKAACENFWLLGVTRPSTMNLRTYFALRAPPPPGYLGLCSREGVNGWTSFLSMFIENQ